MKLRAFGPPRDISPCAPFAQVAVLPFLRKMCTSKLPLLAALCVSKTMSHPRELLDIIEESYDLNSFEDEIFTFMIRCLNRFKNKLPNSIKQELEIANEFRLGNVSETELELSKQRVWTFIAKNKEQIGKQKESLLRALIFTLYPKIESDSDAFEWVDWFIEFSNASTPMEKFQCQLIEEIFAEQLKSA
ncbi:hypothetical protein [Microbulbifer sp. TRSA005]|uniref:hypothetical protein n=1 Tax=Microbulbifer sp. TRSA005 TaxID=3243383 RepID=UPI004039D0F7